MIDNKEHTQRSAKKVMEAARALGMCRKHGVLIEQKLLNPTDDKPSEYTIQYVLPGRGDLATHELMLRHNLDDAIDRWLRDAVIEATAEAT